MQDDVEDSQLLICGDCALEEKQTKTCPKCNSDYCEHNASPTDVRYCKNCMADFKVTESIVTKEIIITNTKNEIISRRVAHAMSYSLEGTDWLFTARKIVTMSDQDLENTIEYHNAVKSIMLNEREHRRMEKAHQLAQIKIVMPKRESQFDKEEKERKAQEKLEAKGQKKSTKTTSKPKSSEDLVKLLMALQKAGLTAEQIQALAGKKTI